MIDGANFFTAFVYAAQFEWGLLRVNVEMVTIRLQNSTCCLSDWVLQERNACAAFL